MSILLEKYFNKLMKVGEWVLRDGFYLSRLKGPTACSTKSRCSWWASGPPVKGLLTMVQVSILTLWLVCALKDVISCTERSIARWLSPRRGATAPHKIP
ncbi:MAG: hypothetical protein KY448_02725, partial [Cyanobacteria bacterium 0813]|nr:hypothetical protein [Cyanobacteria bacterium 0813]